MQFGQLPMLLFMLFQVFPYIYTLVHEYTCILNTTCDLTYDFKKIQNMGKHKL